MKNEITERDVLLSQFSDTYKDVYGVRPTGAAYPSTLPLEAIQHLQRMLWDQLDEQLAEQRFQYRLKDMQRNAPDCDGSPDCQCSRGD